MKQIEPNELLRCATPAKIESKEGVCFMVANTGQPMNVGFYDHPVVLDLSGAAFEKDPSPVLFYHDDWLPIGVTTEQKILANGQTGTIGSRTLNEGGVYALWKFTNSGKVAAEVKENIENGFPYEVSVGAMPLEMLELGRGETYEVNGYNLQGPAYVATRSVIKEVSICVFGACPGTANLKAARLAGHYQKEENTMEEKSVNTAPIAASTSPEVIEKEPANPAPIQAAVVEKAEAPIQAKQEDTAETMRRLSIDTIAKSACVPNGAKVCIDEAEFKTVKAAQNYAVKNGITADAFQKACIEASINRSVGPVVHTSGFGGKRSDVVQASALMNLGISGDWLEKKGGFTPACVEAADRERSNVSMLSIMGDAIKATGGTVDYRNPRRIVEDYKAIHASNVSTSDYGDINVFSPIIDKQMRYRYETLDSIWQRLYRRRVATDFKDVATVDFEVKGRAKDLIENEDFPQVLLTSSGAKFATGKQGIIAGISFESQVNDDMGALQVVAGELVNMIYEEHTEKFWKTFWSVVSTNYTAGKKNKTTKALSVEGLSAAKKLFGGLKNRNGQFIHVVPQFLLVPLALEDVANNLFKWPWAGNATTAGNVHVGKYEVVTDPFLGSEGGITGATDTGWFMVGDTTRYPLGEYVVLAGFETPGVKETWYDHKDALNIRALGTIGFHAYTDKLCAVYSDGTVS